MIDYGMAIPVLLSVICGGLIGLEREYHDKPAGFRTLILICLGSTLFTLVSREFSASGDPARIAAQIVTGIGFLGAGVILHGRMKVQGLTTAATVWVTAAVGMAIGAQMYALSVGCTVLIVILLSPMQILERELEKKYRLHIYDISFKSNTMPLDAIRGFIRECSLRVKDLHYHSEEGEYRIHLSMKGSVANSRLWLQKMMSLPEIKEIAHLGMDGDEE